MMSASAEIYLEVRSDVKSIILLGRGACSDGLLAVGEGTRCTVVRSVPTISEPQALQIYHVGSKPDEKLWQEIRDSFKPSGFIRTITWKLTFPMTCPTMCIVRVPPLRHGKEEKPPILLLDTGMISLSEISEKIRYRPFHHWHSSGKISFVLPGGTAA